MALCLTEPQGPSALGSVWHEGLFVRKAKWDFQLVVGGGSAQPLHWSRVGGGGGVPPCLPHAVSDGGVCHRKWRTTVELRNSRGAQTGGEQCGSISRRCALCGTVLVHLRCCPLLRVVGES